MDRTYWIFHTIFESKYLSSSPPYPHLFLFSTVEQIDGSPLRRHYPLKTRRPLSPNQSVGSLLKWQNLTEGFSVTPRWRSKRFSICWWQYCWWWWKELQKSCFYFPFSVWLITGKRRLGHFQVLKWISSPELNLLLVWSCSSREISFFLSFN